MHKKIIKLFKTLLALALLLVLINLDVIFPKEFNLDKNEAQIVSVVDGDTVDVLMAEGNLERVRLLLIDTPESVHPYESAQLFGDESSEYAKQVLKEGDLVMLEIGNPMRDKFERLLAYIWIDDINFSQLMIEKGYARVAYVYEPNTKYLKEFKKAQRQAKRKKLNIWSIDNYVTENGFDMSVVE